MRKQRLQEIDETEVKFDIEWARETQVTGWVGNIKVYGNIDENEKDFTSMLVYLLQENGIWLKCIFDQQPYFFLECEEELIAEICIHLENKFDKYVSDIKTVEKVDLEQINHLANKQKKYIKLSFRTIGDLITVRNQLRGKIERNRSKVELDILQKKQSTSKDILDHLIDIREYDVPYHCRVCIDSGIRCGKWFTFTLKERKIIHIRERDDLMGMPTLRYIAFDIETSKQPMKFPDSKIDRIVMISLTHSEESILITNREILTKDVLQFDYAPKPEFKTTARIYNEPNEKAVLQRFFTVIRDYKPFIITSFNGDRFDWPFIEDRSLFHNFYVEKEIGIKRQEEQQEYFGRFMVHLDCFPWVERDAYLPQGSHGLKAVTRAKLDYEPIEVDPEKMMKMAIEDPQQFAGYSISDSVATYWLYNKHIHDFILALCTIIPLSPDEVLRKGSGTLCECLLMAMAFSRQIIFPNKKKEPLEKFHNGHLIDTETYIGGKVECLRSGIYRSDIAVEFKMDRERLMSMANGVERLVRFVGKIEGHTFPEYEIQVCSNEIRDKLETMIARGEVYYEKPLIYHLDVAAMYPNIILTNRLQPVSIVDNRICSGCVFNSSLNDCKRSLEWQWRVEYFPVQRGEYETLKMQLESEVMMKQQREMEEHIRRQRLLKTAEQKRFDIKELKDMPFDQQQKMIKQRVKMVSQKTYKIVHQTQTILKQDTVCMRENDFYVRTVRDFRDRRYEFKELVKVWKGKLAEAKAQKLPLKEFQDRIALYDSLQLAHKIILNSFYGYVMRKGARWYSMQMAGIVTHQGSQIISTAKKWVDEIGLPLELDTDGIWCLLPLGFPENFSLLNDKGKKVNFSYPCFMLNELIYEKYKNNQYQWLKDPETLDYGKKEEMSIFFEVDGPYRCMVIPAAREENKQLKKRYVVYNKKGDITELKGFEIKRRGELKIIKALQQEIFPQFLLGDDLLQCYRECAKVAKKWLDILLNEGAGLTDDQVFEYIGENKVLSKDVTEYDQQKGVAITAGKRMTEFLGADQMKGGGINCLFIICKLPHNTPVNERSVPVQLWECHPDIKRKFLRKWFKDSQLTDDKLTLQKIIDWNYYIERLGKTIQKLIVIPSALQKIANPIPDVAPPDWLFKRLREQMSGFHQQKLTNFFTNKSLFKQQQKPMELEDIVSNKKKATEQVLVNTYDPDKEFNNFLKYQKQIWTQQFKNRDKHKMGGNIRNLFQNMTLNVNRSIWQILQINEVSPGIFNLWVLLENGQLTQEQIQMNRVIYVNSRKKENQSGSQIVKKILPRESKAHYLYSFTMEEQKFQDTFQGFSEFLANPYYENIYEQSMPLQFKFISEIGNMCKLISQDYSQKQVYKFEDLCPVFQLPKQAAYLQGLEQTLLSSFVLIQSVQYREMALWSMLSQQWDEYNIIVVSKQKSVDNLRPFFRDGLARILTSKTKIRLHACQTQSEALSIIQQRMELDARQHKLCAIQSAFDSQYLIKLGLKFLNTEIPILRIKEIDTENIKLSSVDWSQKLMKIMLENYIGEVPIELKNLIDMSRYAGIPLCNMGNLSSIIDVWYERCLHKTFNCVSWYGTEIWDTRDLIPSEFTESVYHKSGIYLSYCVDIDVSHLMINTIAVSDELKNMDHEASALLQGDDAILDELVGGKLAFKVLKTIVNGWIDDVQNFNDEMANQLVSQIICWVYNPGPLVDPYLGKMLKRLSLKLFNLLTGRLIQLGAKIIYSSFNRIIISTGKQTLETANSYVQYIIEAVKQHPLFKHIAFHSLRFYTSLLFKDSSNYLGYQIDDQANFVDSKFKMREFIPKKLGEAYTNFLMEILQKVDRYKTQIQEDLEFEPKNIQIVRIQNLEADANIYINNFIDTELAPRIYKSIEHFTDSYISARKNYETMIENQNTIQVEELIVPHKNKRIIDSDDEEINDDYEKDSFIADDNEDPDIDDIPQEERQLEEDVDKELDFQQEWLMQPVIGAQFDMEDDPGILRMIIYLVEMLSLNDETTIIMNRIKSNACKLLKISAFSQAVKFKEPCINLNINNVTCNSCQTIVDLAVFKELINDTWNCSVCQAEFDPLYIEERICQYLESQILLFQIQDLYCLKCKQSQSYIFQEKCQCSGMFTFKQSLFDPCFIKSASYLHMSLYQLSAHKGLKRLKALLNSMRMS